VPNSLIWLNFSILPKNGTAPFILTIAPTLHPPYNITLSTMSAINWTVSLTWASPFFISLVDSLGNSWANGPLHSGEGTSNSCLDETSSTANKSKMVAVGVGAGVGGALFGLLISYLSLRYRARKESSEGYLMSGQKAGNWDTSGPPILEGVSAPDSHYAAVPSGPSPVSNSHSTLINRQYQVEPFVMREDGYRDPQTPTPASTGPASHYSDPGSQPSTSSQQDRSQVYVVHHDGGRPPVTVYTADGADVVELPPRYADGDGPPTAQRRRPAANPTKNRGSR